MTPVPDATTSSASAARPKTSRMAVAVFVLGLLIILAILIPAVLGALDLARAQSTVSHLSSLCHGIEEYARWNQDQFPPPSSWDKTLLNTGKVTANTIFAYPGNPIGTRSYAMNSALAGLRTSDVPGNTVLLFECASGSPPGGGRELLPAEPRNRGAYFIGFVDGRVTQVPPHMVEFLLWNPPPVAQPPQSASKS
jgi:hypothetical protein